jgi:ribonuclease H / adenosylcobalamin/alpha-ribazole phosphatase
VIEKLVLVRHGQTVQNVAGIAQGWNDSELSDAGRDQVLRLAKRLAHMKATSLYSSPLGRAMSTAQAISEATGLPITTLDDLREMNYGGWEGRSFLDVRREDEETYQRWIADEACPCPGGESHVDVRRRLERALAAMTSSRPIVVTHGTALRIAVTALLELPVMHSRYFAQDNAALNVFVSRGGRWVMKCWNDDSHCER